jgi:ribosomal protein L37AE/L43A
MKREDRESGNCGFCEQPRIQFPNGIWACPHFYGSSLHGQFYLTQDHEGNPLSLEDNENRWRKEIEEYTGLSLEAYLWFIGKWNPNCPRCGKRITYIDGAWICFTPYWNCGIMCDGYFKVDNMELKFVE